MQFMICWLQIKIKQQNIAKVELSRKLFAINFLQAIDKQTHTINIYK